MNEANLQRLIDHVKGLSKPVKDWSYDHCFAGMAQAITGNEERSMALYEFLELDLDDPVQEAIRYDLTYRGNAPGSMHADIAALPLDEQKRVMIHALETARDGAVVWLA